MARLWLEVIEFHDGPGYGHPSELWWKDLTLEHAPDIGDKIMFLGSADEPEGSTDLQVRDRYWMLDGTLHIELRRIVHLPNAQFEKDYNSRLGRHLGDDEAHYLRHCPMPWRALEEIDCAPLDERLAESGWYRYAELRNK